MYGTTTYHIQNILNTYTARRITKITMSHANESYLSHFTKLPHLSN